MFKTFNYIDNNELGTKYLFCPKLILYVIIREHFVKKCRTKNENTVLKVEFYRNPIFEINQVVFLHTYGQIIAFLIY